MARIWGVQLCGSLTFWDGGASSQAIDNTDCGKLRVRSSLAKLSKG